MPEEAVDKKACTVTQAMNVAKRGLEQIRLTVVGEVSEFNDRSGYKAAYFTIRDDGAAMSCLMWRDAYNACGIRLQQGMLVQVTGMFSCYPARGTMQFTVRRMELAGEGNLRMQVARLAAKLEAEGLMDQARKRRTPALPKRIAIITSPRGKAIRDCLRTLRRRYPLGEVQVFGVNVEGEAAPQNMITALQAAQQAQPAPDVILLVRGGGSYESMMPFNDEGLARAVAACTIPVVTGIGHEPDNSIADMVADRRCSTPTAAAEAIAPSVTELAQKVANATKALNNAYAASLLEKQHRLERLHDRPLWQDPHYLTGQGQQAVDSYAERLGRALPVSIAAHKTTVDALGTRLHVAIPDAYERQQHELKALGERLVASGPKLTSVQRVAADALQGRLVRAGKTLTQTHEEQMALAAAKLDALSPLKTLSRGYSITYAQDGKSVIDSIDRAAAGDNVRVRLQDGSLDCVVQAIERQE